MENTYKHYIRTNEVGTIIDAFSDAFKTPMETDILLKECEERHFTMVLRDALGWIYEYKIVNVNGYKKLAVVERDRHIDAIAQLKTNKLAQVKKECAHTIDTSTVQFKGEPFGCSMVNQHNWIALLTSNAAGMLTYPLNVFSADGKSITVIDEMELKQVTGMIFQVVYSARSVCNAKQVLIDKATTADEVNAV